MRRISRREFVEIAGSTVFVVAASLALPGCTTQQSVTPPQPPPFTFAKNARIRKFAVGLPGLGADGANEIGQFIPLAKKSSSTFAGMATDTYDLAVAEFSENMHHDLPGPTTVWGYYDRTTNEKKYLGGVIVAKRGTPVMLNVANQLPNKQLIPIDPTLMAGPNGQMVGDLPYNRIVTHLHGGFTPWFSDGTPFQWYDPAGKTGASFMNVPGTKPATGSMNYYYPMQQSARMAWYHDHAIGITRTNVYAGIVSALIIVDDFEIGLVNKGLLPDLIGTPLVIQDKAFVPSNMDTLDPAWKWGGPGSLWYPHIYLPNALAKGKSNPIGRWNWGPTIDTPSKGTQLLPPVSAVPECFFDTIVVNGGLYPEAKVPPKRVRFRMLDGSQARFYHVNLFAEDPSNPGEAKVGAAGPTMYQVGTEGGFLPAVAVHKNAAPLKRSDAETVNPDGPFNLLVAPAERADVVIDFNGVPVGSSFILYNDAPSPFPGGDPRNDYYTGDPNQLKEGGAPTTPPGYGPNTRTLMKIVVEPGSGDSMSTDAWLKQLNVQLKNNFLTGNQPGLFYNDGDPSVPAFPFHGTVTRHLTLNEDFDEYGRLVQTVGTFASKSTNNQGLPTWGLSYLDGATETPAAGATEVWQIFNLTADTHPMHFHLVNVQLIQRQKFEGNPSSYKLSGAPMRPDTNEVGWKETVRCNPGEVTTVIMKFDLPKLPTAEMTSAVSPRTGGHEYGWHCHILEHEEHDMMRPLVVK